MGRKKQAVHSEPNKPRFFELGGFVALVDNKFEAAFTVGRMINLVNHVEAYQWTIGNPLTPAYIATYVCELEYCCKMLGLSDAHEKSMLQIIKQLTASLTASPQENGESNNERVHRWLREGQDSSHPNVLHTRLQTSNKKDPLVEIRDALFRNKKLSTWIKFGIEIDQVFRGGDLDYRILKSPLVFSESSTICGGTLTAPSSPSCFNQNSRLVERDRFWIDFRPGWQLYGLPHRNRSINLAFGRYVGLPNLITANSKVSDKKCEMTIDSKVRDHIQSVIHDASKIASSIYKPLGVA